MPGHRANLSFWPGTRGRTRVVVASRIHDFVGPREKKGPKCTFVWAVVVERKESRLRAVESCILAVA